MADEGGSAFARDPMEQKWWTLPMALAWALWKTPEMVDWAWPAKVSEHHNGKPISVAVVLWHFRFDEAQRNAFSNDRGGSHQTIAEAQSRSVLDQLTDALENGRIRADGTDAGTEAHRAIGLEDWRKADIGSLHLNSDLPEHDTLYVRRTRTPILLGVRVLREDVLREFDEVPATGAREAEPVEAPTVADVVDVDPADVREVKLGPARDIAPEISVLPELAKPRRGKPRRTAAAIRAKADSQAIRRDAVRQFLVARGGTPSIRQVQEAVRVKFDGQVSASRSTIQTDLAAIRTETAQKE